VSSPNTFSFSLYIILFFQFVYSYYDSIAQWAKAPGHKRFWILDNPQGFVIPQLETVVEINSRFRNFLPVFYFPNLFSLFLFHLPYLTKFPFSFFSFCSPFPIVILSNFSKMAGSQVGGIMNPHLQSTVSQIEFD
jgi:hypothetical protein